MIGIYKITNPKGKIYIGQSNNILNRWKYNYFNVKCINQTKLYNSLKKHSPEAHIFEIIEECSLEQLNERETYWGLFYNVLEDGLNCKLGEGRGACSEKTKQKMSDSAKKKIFTQKHKNNISKGTKGISKPKGFGENHSKKMKGIPKPKGFGEKVSLSNLGKKFSQKTKDKMGKQNNKITYQYNKKGELINIFKSATIAAKNINVNRVNMFAHLGGKYKTCKGFIFKYTNA